MDSRVCIAKASARGGRGSGTETAKVGTSFGNNVIVELCACVRMRVQVGENVIV